MSLLNNPSIVTNGLVFNYDVNNNKSYRSPPIRNILNQITPRGMSVGTLYNFSSGTENVYIPALGWINNCQYVDMYNDFNGGSNNCCPSPYGYGDGLAVSPSTLYTYAIVYKSTNGYTHPNYMYHYEYASNGSYLTEYGVFGNNGSTAKIRSLGDDWFWASATFTSNASAATMNTGSWMYEYGRFNRFHVAKVMLVEGNYIDMPPSLWPELNTTVSNTQALVDLTGSKTIELTNANTSTFNSDYSALTLNGTNQYLYTSGDSYWNAWSPNGVNGNSSLSIEVVFNSSDTGGFLVSRPWNGSGQYNYTMTADGFGLFVGSAGASLGYGNICTGNTVHMTYWMNATQYGVYRNGQTYVAATNHGLTGSGGSAGTGAFGTLFGSLYPYGGGWGGEPGFSINGKFYVGRIYNKVLTAAEVQQNFQALRGRYGI
jgi:hypothetical protein